MVNAQSLGPDDAPGPSYEEFVRIQRQFETSLAMERLDERHRELLKKPLVSPNGAAISSGLTVAWPYPTQSAVAHGEEVATDFESQLKRARWPIREVSATDYSANSANALTVRLKNKTFMRYEIRGNAVTFQSSLSTSKIGRDLVAMGDGQVDIYFGIIEGSLPARAERYLTYKIEPARGEVLYAAIRYEQETQSRLLELVFRNENSRVFAETHTIKEAWKKPVQLKQRIQIGQKTFAAVGLSAPAPPIGNNCEAIFRSATGPLDL